MCAHQSAVLANFYAPWCPWCQRLEPTWESVQQKVHEKYPDADGRIRMGKVKAACLPARGTLAATCVNMCCNCLTTSRCGPMNCAAAGGLHSGGGLV